MPVPGVAQTRPARTAGAVPPTSDAPDAPVKAEQRNARHRSRPVGPSKASA